MGIKIENGRIFVYFSIISENKIDTHLSLLFHQRNGCLFGNPITLIKAHSAAPSSVIQPTLSNITFPGPSLK